MTSLDVFNLDCKILFVLDDGEVDLEEVIVGHVLLNILLLQLQVVHLGICVPFLFVLRNFHFVFVKLFCFFDLVRNEASLALWQSSILLMPGFLQLQGKAQQLLRISHLPWEFFQSWLYWFASRFSPISGQNYSFFSPARRRQAAPGRRRRSRGWSPSWRCTRACSAVFLIIENQGWKLWRWNRTCYTVFQESWTKAHPSTFEIWWQVRGWGGDGGVLPHAPLSSRQPWWQSWGRGQAWSWGHCLFSIRCSCGPCRFRTDAISSIHY